MSPARWFMAAVRLFFPAIYPRLFRGPTTPAMPEGFTHRWSLAERHGFDVGFAQGEKAARRLSFLVVLIAVILSGVAYVTAALDLGSKQAEIARLKSILEWHRDYTGTNTRFPSGCYRMTSLGSASDISGPWFAYQMTDVNDGAFFTCYTPNPLTRTASGAWDSGGLRTGRITSITGRVTLTEPSGMDEWQTRDDATGEPQRCVLMDDLVVDASTCMHISRGAP